MLPLPVDVGVGSNGQYDSWQWRDLSWRGNHHSCHSHQLQRCGGHQPGLGFRQYQGQLRRLSEREQHAYRDAR